MKRVLILCTGNCCRSQLAEALWNHLGKGEWTAFSAGSNPAGFVHPLAIEAIEESGIDPSAQRSQHVDEFVGQNFDLVVTVCDNAQKACPAFPGAKQTLHWPFPDPVHASGDHDERMKVFRDVRDQIAARIGDYLKRSALSENR